MHGYNWHGMGGTLVWFIWIPLIILIVLFILKLISTEDKKRTQNDSSIEILKRRYARGEIGRDEYEDIKRVLESK